MKIEVLDFSPALNFVRTGYVKVKYYDLTMSLEVRFNIPKNYTWFKMPQAIGLNKKYYNTCNWEDKAHSDEFQNEIRQQLAVKFPDALKIPDKVTVNKSQKDFRKRKQLVKKANEQVNSARANPPRGFNNPSAFIDPPRRARPQSRFS